MKAYILFEMKKGFRHVWEYDNAVWLDLNELHAYIANLLDLPGSPHVEKLPNCDNVWRVEGRFEIVECELNGIHEPDVTGFTDVEPLIFERALREYVLDGVHSEGSFKWYLLSGQLFEASRKADSGNLRQMRELVEWIRTYAPAACYGSPEKVRAWMEKGGLQGLGEHYVAHFERQFNG